MNEPETARYIAPSGAARVTPDSATAAGSPDHIHKLAGKTVKVGRELGFGKRNKHGTCWLFTRQEIGLIREEVRRRALASKGIAIAAPVVGTPEYDRARRRRDSEDWRNDWRREALVEMKQIELALLDLSRRLHGVAALVLAELSAPWNKGRRSAVEEGEVGS